MKNTAPKSSIENRPSKNSKALAIGAVREKIKARIADDVTGNLASIRIRSLMVGVAENEDAAMGAQLTSQYERAVGGMTEVLKFGALVMMLRQYLANMSTRGHVSKKPGGADGDGGMEGWLKRFAPSIKKPTAYRFLHVAESVAESFTLPAKASFIELATKPAAELPANLQKKQLELWDFVSGTSQRSWLDRLASVVARAGAADEELGAQLTLRRRDDRGAQVRGHDDDAQASFVHAWTNFKTR
jgi:hypothetical protein